MCGARFLVAAFLALWSVALGAQEAEQGAGAPAPEQPTAVFEEAVDVNAVTVHVSVVDRDGQPVRGLGANAFAVFEGNQLLEVVGVDELGGGTGGGQRPAHLVILVDNTSLQKRSRAKVLDGVAELAAQAATAGSRVMVVVLGEQREVLLPLSSDPAAVRLALTSVADAKTYGELSASAKRSLKREISGVDLHRDMAPATTNPFAASAGTQHINVFGQQYLQRINGLRLQELKRARFNLFQVEDLLRGMAGLPGRKDLVWVTEDLEICPLLDVYQVFYGKFDTWAQELGLQHPEQWAQEAELTEPLTQLSFVATASGTALHVLDLTDRDRQAADVSMDVTDKAMFAAGTAAGERSAAGYDLAGTGGMVGGFREAARSTGGSFHSGGSDRASFFKSFGACVTSGYAVTYQRPGAADGQVHPVRVELRGAGELIAPNAVGNRTLLQVLADQTMTRLLLGVGDDPMGVVVRLGSSESAADGKSVRAIHVDIPSASIGLEARGEEHVGSLVLLFQSMDVNGNVLPPQVLQQPLHLPAARVAAHGTVRASARLMLADDTRRLAVGVFDEMSGDAATALVELAGAGD